MRVDQLDLERYGCFTDLRLDLRAPGLHVVVGPNEAGKSTARAAVTDLLFGFPHRSPQAHIHASSDLCIAADISSHGSTVRLRRSRRRPYLSDVHGVEVDEALLGARLGGIDRDLFTSLFAIGHDELREGASHLLHTKGDVGRALFGAATGKAGAGALLDRLKSEADDLFKPRAPKSAVMAAVAAYAAARTALDQATLPPAEWARAYEELAAIDADLRALVERKAELDSDLERLRLVRATRPYLASIASARSALAACALPRVAAEARERFTMLCEELAVAERDIATAGREIERLDAERPPPHDPQILAYEPALSALQQDIGAFRLAVSELPRQEARVVAARTAASAAAKACGADGAEGVAPVPASTRAELRYLSRELDEAQRAVADAADREREAARNQVRAAVALEAVPELPDTVEVSSLAAALTPLVERREQLGARLAALAAERSDHERDAGALRRVAALPDVSELESARRDRDDAVATVLHLWQTGAPLDADAVARLERTCTNADSLADRFRAAAAEVERVGVLDSLISRASAHIAELEAEEAAATSAIEETKASLAALLSCRDIHVPHPDHLASLLGAAEALVAHSAERRSERSVLALAAARAVEDHEARVVALREAEGGFALVQRQWEAACSAASLPVATTPQGALAHLEALAAHDAAERDCAQAAADVAETEARIERFSRAALDVVADVAPDLATLTPDDAVETLTGRLRSAASAVATAEALAHQRSAACAAKSAAEKRAANTMSAIVALREAVGIDSQVDFEAASAESRRAEALETQIEEMAELLAKSAEGRTLAELVDYDQNAPEHPAEVDAAIAEIEAELASAETRLGELHRRHGELTTTLAQWRGADDAAVAAGRIQASAAAAGELATRHVRLRIAHEILRREVERNREDNQGPVLRRASEHLAALTNQRFLTVLDGADDGGVLEVRRFDGEPIGVDGLSEGTRDQLWLALRLAALERWSEHREPLPLVLDDVCVTFDDERTAAALELLASFTDRFQVLFFTHHESVAALAARTVKSGEVHVHRLERFIPARPARAPKPGRRQRKASPPAA